MEHIGALIVWALAQFGYSGPVYDYYVGPVPASFDPGIQAWAHPDQVPHHCRIGMVAPSALLGEWFSTYLVLHEIGHCLGLGHEDGGIMDGYHEITTENWLALRRWRLDFPYRVAVPGIAR